MPEMMIAEQLARLRRQRTAPLILELDLTDGVAEGPPADPVSAVLTMRRARLSDLLDGLRRARSDPRVQALGSRHWWRRWAGGPSASPRSRRSGARSRNSATPAR